MVDSLQKQMKRIYGKTSNLLQMIEVRRNSAQASFSSLLRVKYALRALHVEHQDDAVFPAELGILGDPEFWVDMLRAEPAFISLREASLILQKSAAIYGNVLHCYGRLYMHMKHNQVLAEVLEKRFKKEEIPLLILLYALDDKRINVSSKLRLGCTNAMLGNEALCNFAVFYYKKHIGSSTGQSFGNMFKYLQGELCHNSIYSQYQDPVELWAFNETKCSHLSRLATTVLSIVVQSATSECLFSTYRYFHTKIRNITIPDKIHKLAEVKRMVEAVNKEETLNSNEQENRSRIFNSAEFTKVLPSVLVGPSPDKDCFDNGADTTNDDHTDTLGSIDPLQ